MLLGEGVLVANDDVVALSPGISMRLAVLHARVVTLVEVNSGAADVRMPQNIAAPISHKRAPLAKSIMCVQYPMRRRSSNRPNVTPAEICGVVCDLVSAARNGPGDAGPLKELEDGAASHMLMSEKFIDGIRPRTVRDEDAGGSCPYFRWSWFLS